MARKRGGVAGFYDRNKGWLKKAVPAGLSFIPGVGIPLAAAAGAAFGADKEGRSFFNLSNIPGALRGAVEGYGIGKGTQAVAGGVKGLLAPKIPKGLEAGTSALEGLNVPDLNLPNVPTGLRARGVFEGMGGGDLAPVNMASRVGLTPGMTAQGSFAPQQAAFRLGGQVAPVDVSRLAAAGGRTLGAPPPNMNIGMTPGAAAQGSFAPQQAAFRMGGQVAPVDAGRVTANTPAMLAPTPTPTPMPAPTGTLPAGQMRFRQAMYQPQVLAAGVQGLLGALPDARSAAMDAQTRLAQQQFDEDRRRFQMEEERKRRIAELLMPYMQQNFPQYLGGR